MSEESKALQKGVIVEFDFTVLDGAKILFDVAAAQLAPRGVELTPRLEAAHLAGGNYQGAFAELYAKLEKKHDAAKSARELAEGFRAALDAKLPGSVTGKFKAFVGALVAKGVRVVVSTRADAEVLRGELAEFPAEQVCVYSEPSSTYGSLKWDAWRRACLSNHLSECLAVAVVGSGFSARAALVAGLASVAVENPRVAWQDFGGIDAMVPELDAAAASEVLRALHID